MLPYDNMVGGVFVFVCGCECVGVQVVALAITCLGVWMCVDVSVWVSEC